MPEERQTDLSLSKLLELIESRWPSVVFGSHDLSEKEIVRVRRALEIAALVLAISNDA